MDDQTGLTKILQLHSFIFFSMKVGLFLQKKNPPVAQVGGMINFEHHNICEVRVTSGALNEFSSTK